MKLERIMATINVRRLDEEVVRRLKRRAAENNRSLESEVRHILQCASEDNVSAKRKSFQRVGCETAAEDQGARTDALRASYQERSRQRTPGLMCLVVDASVAIKWLVEEEGSETATRLLEGNHELHAPRLMVSEVTNALWRKGPTGWNWTWRGWDAGCCDCRDAASLV